MHALENPLSAASPFAPLTTQASPADAGSGSSSGSSSSTSTATITANDFLQLLVTELQNQDPTANTDPNEYVDQLVQVNSLQQLVQINQNLSTDANGNPVPTTIMQQVVQIDEGLSNLASNSGSSGSSGSGSGGSSSDTRAMAVGAHSGNLNSHLSASPNLAAAANHVATALEPKREAGKTASPYAAGLSMQLPQTSNMQ